MKLELTNDGFEKIEAKIQEMETLASDGVFTQADPIARFQKIVSEIKKLRQIVRENCVFVPGSDGPKAA